MATRISVVYARAATGLKVWPIAVFCTSETAAEDARASAAAALAEGKRFRAGTGIQTVAHAEVRE